MLRFVEQDAFFYGFSLDDQFIRTVIVKAKTMNLTILAHVKEVRWYLPGLLVFLLYALAAYESHWFFEARHSFILPVALLLDVAYLVFLVVQQKGLRMKRPKPGLEGLGGVLLFLLALVLFFSPTVYGYFLVFFVGMRMFQVLCISSDEDRVPETDSEVPARSGFHDLTKKYSVPIIFVLSIGFTAVSLFFTTMVFLFIPMNQVDTQLGIPVLLFGLAILLQRWLSVNLVIPRIQLLLLCGVLVSMHLTVYKALWPTNHESNYGLSERSSNYASIGGWDWSRSWLRFKASPEEVEQVVSQLKWTVEEEGEYNTYPLIKDSLKRLPPYRLGMGGGFDPFRKIEEPCLHWHVDEGKHLPLSVYYHEESGTLEIFKTEEMDMDPRGRY